MGRHVGAHLDGHQHDGHLDGHQHGSRKPRETPVTEFCYKGANLFLEELKNIKIRTNTRTHSDSQISRNNSQNKSLLTNSVVM